MSKVAKISLQDYADRVVGSGFRQTLKTPQEVVAIQGWRDAEYPSCCGVTVEVTTIIGTPYFAECNTCGKWAATIDGPVFSESGTSCSFLDPDKVDVETEARWIVGKLDIEPKTGVGL